MRANTGTALLAALHLAALPASAQDLGLWAGGTRIAAHPLPVCLVWNHSVTGGLVADCFTVQDGVLVLDRAYLHDFAAGLGEVQGRGHLRPDPRGGYWIDDIAEPLPNGLHLRIGGPGVAHRLMPDPFGPDLTPLPHVPGRVTLRLDP